MKLKIAFFDTKPYDKDLYRQVNEKYGFDITFFKYHLTSDNVILTQGFDAVVVFVNDIITGAMIDELTSYGVKLIALRSSGFNNVDLKAALDRIRVVRVPLEKGSPATKGMTTAGAVALRMEPSSNPSRTVRSKR